MLKNTLGLLASAALVLGASQAASAADLAVKALAPAPIATWTGFYIGAHVGAGWGTTESTLTSATLAPAPPVAFTLPIAQNSRSGFLGGGQVGYNWQTGWAVLGVQGDIAGMDVKGTTPCIVVFSCTAKSDWLATVSGRVGAVVADRALLYVKGGAAWMNTTHSLSAPAALLGGGLGLGTGALTSVESTASGWLLGMGVEYMFANHWTGFIEYNYIDFNTKSETLTFAAIPGVSVNTDFRNKLSIAKVGVNYKF
jgi:outer membrane immunogenic protein